MMRSQMKKLSGLMQEGDEKGLLNSNDNNMFSADEMMKSVWKNVGEGKVKRKKVEKKKRKKLSVVGVAELKQSKGFGGSNNRSSSSSSSED